MVKTSTQPDTLTGWMSALADDTRLRLLRLLERHELGVADLCDILQLPQSTVSRHLKLLSDQHWTLSRRVATNHLYRTILDELDPSARKLWLLAREQTESWATVQQDDLRLNRRLRERTTDSQAFFAGAAGDWDRIRAELYGDSFALDAMLSLLSNELVIADLGCGTGAIVEKLSPHVKTVIGIDNSQAMLKAARRRLQDLSNVDLRRGELNALPIDDASCDVAMLVLTLTYATDPSSVIREAVRILKPGGKLVIVDLLQHDRDDFRRQMEQAHAGFVIGAVVEWIEELGLKNTIARALPPDADAKGPVLFLVTGRMENRLASLTELSMD